jgi:hypothetical protein
MSGNVVITWEADDGYAGPSRPHQIVASVSDFSDLDPEEREALVEAMVRGEFEEKVSYAIKDIKGMPE